MNEVKAKAKGNTNTTQFRELSTGGIIIFSLGIPTHALVVYLLFNEGNIPYPKLATIIYFILSIILSPIFFFIIRFIFYRLPPMGKKIALPLIWITGLPGFIAFVIWYVLFVSSAIAFIIR